VPLALFPADRQLPDFAAGFGVQGRLKEIALHRLDSGEPVGWPAIFASSWNWMSSRPSVWLTVERELAGNMFCKPWFAID
jgi:hypothetical protein